MSDQVTIAAAFVHNLIAGAELDQEGIDHVLTDCGISSRGLRLPQSRVTFEQMSRLTQKLVAITGDENFGLTSRPLPKGSFSLACMAAVHGQTLQDFINTYNQFFLTTNSALYYELTVEGDQAIYSIRRAQDIGLKNCYILEARLLALHRLLCWISNCRIPISKACFEYDIPEHAQEYRYMFYGAPCTFREQHNSIIFPAKYLQRENVRDYSQLQNFLEGAPLNLVSQTITNDDLTSQVRHWLAREIIDKHHCPDLVETAEYFRVHPQALRRKLAVLDVPYRTLKSDVRRDIAINRVQEDSLSIEEMAFQLDFSDASAFIRAFRSWTGMTPLAYRKVHQIIADSGTSSAT